MLQRLDFIPCDLGGFIRESRARASLAAVFAQRGWAAVPIDSSDSEIVPNVVGLWSKDGVEIYVPVSGIAVVRHCERSDREAADCSAEMLISRIAFHRAIGDGCPDALNEAMRVLTAATRILADQEGFARRPGETCRFRYVMSVFVAPAHYESGVIAALANPRVVGCSASESARLIPDLETVSERNAAVDPSVIEAVEGVANGPRFTAWATWSSVVCRPRDSSVDSAESVVSLVSLIEYRVQSSWFAAQLYGDIASDFCTGAERAVGVREFEWLSVEFDSIVLSVERRIGSGAPQERQDLFHAVATTSGLASEVERAARSVEVGRRISKLTTGDRNHRTTMITEMLLLVFAAAGVGQLILRLPVNSVEAVTSQWRFVLALVVLIVIGAVMIARRQR